MAPRPSGNPAYAGKTFGSNAAAWWGFHYNDMIEEPKPREVITIYEVDASGAGTGRARSTTTAGCRRPTRPAWCTTSSTIRACRSTTRTITKNMPVLEGVRVPIRPHFGTMGVAPAEADMVDSIPPSYFGGNIDNWRIGKGGTMYYPIAVEGALLSAGDPHAAQGDSELAGTAIETSLTGVVQITLHKADSLRRHADRGPRLSAARDRWRVGRARLQLCQLPGRAGRERAAGHLRQVLGRRRACATPSASCASS